jgi:hypothetical protein
MTFRFPSIRRLSQAAINLVLAAELAGLTIAAATLWL